MNSYMNSGVPTFQMLLPEALRQPSSSSFHTVGICGTGIIIDRSLMGRNLQHLRLRVSRLSRLSRSGQEPLRL